MSFMSMFLQSFNPGQAGYMFMWVILACGIVCLAISIERFIFLTMRTNRKSEKFVKQIIDFIQKDDIVSAQKICSKTNSALSTVMKQGLEESGAGSERIRNAVDESSLKLIPELENRTSFLGTIGNIATLLGLMGTIYGLIIAFAAVGRPGIDPAEKSNLLAQGIAAAMNTTYLGLLVAIPSIALYTFFKAKTQGIIDEIDEYSLRLVNVLVERSYKARKFHISAAQLKEGIGLHVTHNNIKVYTDNKLIKDIAL
jgi:biopolymer transport protein ExbB/TolQ